MNDNFYHLNESKKKWFFNLLISSTLFCIIFLSVFTPFRNIDGIDKIFQLLLLLSTMHVGLTGFFFIDKEYRDFALQKNKLYYVYFPLLTIFSCSLISGATSGDLYPYVFIFYHAWLLYHFGRQNYGILAFSLAAQKLRPIRLEKLSFYFISYAGILKAYGIVNQFMDSSFGPYYFFVNYLAYIFLFVAIFIAIIPCYQKWRGKNYLPSLFIFIGMIFYAPVFIFDNYSQAVMSFAVAHAVQYFIFMFFLSAGSNEEKAILQIIQLVLVMMFIFIFILISRESNLFGLYKHYVMGGALGLIMWHFIMDAGFWKMSQNWQKGQIKQRFGFLFRVEK